MVQPLHNAFNVSLRVLVVAIAAAGMGCCATTKDPNQRGADRGAQGGTRAAGLQPDRHMADAVPISVSVVEEGPTVRQLKITVEWSAEPAAGETLYLSYDVYRDKADPPYTHLKPQEVVKFQNESKNWQLVVGQVTEGRNDAGNRTWTFDVPLEQNWDVLYPWNGHVRLRVTAFVKSGAFWRGATGSPTGVLVPNW